MISRRQTIFGALASVTGAPYIVTRGWAAEPANLEAARREGTVLWYTTLIINQAILPLKAAFERKYPGVTLQYVRNDEAPTAIRLLNEARAGRVQADIFDGLSVMEPLRREGLVASLHVAERRAVSGRNAGQGWILACHSPLRPDAWC